MSKNSKILKKRRKIQAQRLEAMNQENEKIKIFIWLPIVFFLLGICQIIGKVFDIDFLIFISRSRMERTRTGYFPVPISLGFAYVIMVILERSSYLTTLIRAAKNQSQRLQKHPRLYKIVKFVYKHPIWSYLIANISYTIIETFLIYVVKI